MRVYPSPVELIMIFQQTLPPELFKVRIVTIYNQFQLTYL